MCQPIIRKYGLTINLDAQVSALILLCSFPWFQGWAKSFIASNISSKLSALGEQVNMVEKTTKEMHSQLESHQSKIDSYQKELADIQKRIQGAELSITSQQADITNQFEKISLMQSGLNTAQTNLTAQQVELADVSYWVKNLYSKTVTETFSIADTNNFMITYTTNKSFGFVVRLSHYPIEGSIERILTDTTTRLELRSWGHTSFYNLVFGAATYYDINHFSVSYHYVIDERKTNMYTRVPKLNSELIMNDSGDTQRLTLPEFIK